MSPIQIETKKKQKKKHDLKFDGVSFEGLNLIWSYFLFLFLLCLIIIKG